MSKKKYYMVLDTETATLPFANYLAKTAQEKQKIAIAKPLVYDIGWVVCDRHGEIVKKKNYLVQETFFVPQVFNTAYYKDKRPIYIELLNRQEIVAANWNDIIIDLMKDLADVEYASAYNACFDYKKAIPFTERYISNLYSVGYQEWEKKQYKKCVDILQGKDKSNNPEYLKPYFELKNIKYPIVDLWGVACERLINNDRYRDYCMNNSLLTASATYFKTSAETSFQYLMRRHDFVEQHTALDDALIETEILIKALKKGKIEPQLGAFPFRNLGTTIEYTQKKPKYKKTVQTALFDYIEASNGWELAEEGNRYWRRMVTTYNALGTQE